MKARCICLLAALFLAGAGTGNILGQESTYAKAKGDYVGLTFPLDGSVHAGSAYLRLNLGKLGGVSGTLILGGRKRSVTGHVRADGQASLVLQTIVDNDIHGYDYPDYPHPEPEYRGTAYVRFDLQGTPGSVRGWLERNPEVQLSGKQITYKSGSNPAPQKGNYTFVISGGDGVQEPAGMGYGSVKLEADGTLRMNGLLADGHKVTQRTKIAPGGAWSLMVPMFGGHGSVLGSLSFGNTATEGPSGMVFWTKPADHSGNPYPNGWTNGFSITGSPYVRPASKQPVLALDQGVAVFSGADLAVPSTNTFSVKGSSFVSTGPTRFSLSIAASTGVLSGTFVHPVTGKKISFKGAVLQNQNCGYGYWLSSSKDSGLAYIGPAP